MDWNVIGAAFMANAVAELGDRTQILVIALSASSGKPFSVFIGAVLGIAVVCGVSAALGEGIVKAISAERLQKLAALAFVAMGLWMWVRSGRAV